MTKCRAQPAKRRVRKPHGKGAHSFSLSSFGRSIKGHAWEGHGEERHCKLCGYMPAKYRPGIDKHSHSTSYANGKHYTLEHQL